MYTAAAVRAIHRGPPAVMTMMRGLVATCHLLAGRRQSRAAAKRAQLVVTGDRPGGFSGTSFERLAGT